MTGVVARAASGATRSAFCLRLANAALKRELLHSIYGMLRHVAALGGHSPGMAPAIRRLHAEYHQPLPVEELAEEVGLSASRFHYHFKSVTGMTPLQFQKQLRLQEARLLLTDDLDAATAGYRVGYSSASHFSRDYKRLFGDPPMQDVARP